MRYKKYKFAAFAATVFLMLALYPFFFLSSFSSRKDKIFVFLSSDADIYEEVLSGIHSVFGSKVAYDYLNILEAEERNLGPLFKELKQKNFSGIIAIGPSAANASYAYSDLPVLFSMVSSPKSLERRGKPLCGVSMHIPIEEYFRVLKEIRPNAGRVYTIYSTDEGEFLFREGEYLDLKYKLFFTGTRVASDREFRSVLDSLKGKIDAFYIVSDPIYNLENFKALSDFCKKNKIILISSFKSLARLGSTFALSPDYSKIGVLTGQMAKRVFRGETSCEKEGVRFLDRSSYFLYLNREYAKAARTPIPPSILQRAETVKLFKAGVDFFKDGKLISAKIIFEKILRNDPTNVAADYYLGIILEKLTRGKIDKLEAAIEKYLEKGEYAKAVSAYEKILRLNPRLRRAKEGLQNTRKDWSHSLMQRGEALERAGKPFEAIKVFQNSLEVFPANTASQTGIQRIRNRLRPQLPSIIQEGIDDYNRRNYKKAIQLFNNSLLIQPGNRKVLEYLRLAKKKKKAIERFLRSG